MSGADPDHPSVVRVKDGRVQSVDICTKVLIGALPFYAHQAYTRSGDAISVRSITPGGGGTRGECQLKELPEALWEAFTADQISPEHLGTLFPDYRVIVEE